jgi:hypothetical protein
MKSILILILFAICLVGCKSKPHDTIIYKWDSAFVMVDGDTMWYDKNSVYFINIDTIDDSAIQIMPFVGEADTFYVFKCNGKEIYSYSPIVENIDSLKHQQ